MHGLCCCIFWAIPWLLVLFGPCSATAATTTISGGGPPSKSTHWTTTTTTASSPVAQHQNQTMSDDDDDDEEDGEDLPSEIINAASRPPRPIQPLSSSDLEERLRRLTETMEKIQRADDLEEDREDGARVGSTLAAKQTWPARSFEHSGQQPPWDQSDDEDEPYQHGSGSGDEPPHQIPGSDDEEVTIQHSPRPTDKHDDTRQYPASSDRPDSGQCTMHSASSARIRVLLAGLASLLLYRWTRFD